MDEDNAAASDAVMNMYLIIEFSSLLKITYIVLASDTVMTDTVAITASGAIIDPVETAMFPMSSRIATTASAVGIGGMGISAWGSVPSCDPCIATGRLVTARHHESLTRGRSSCRCRHRAMPSCIVCLPTYCYDAMTILYNKCMYVV